MTLLLFTGLALIGLFAVLGLRSLTFSHAAPRRTHAQFDAYGFATAVNPEREHRGPSELAAAAAAAVGARLAHRLDAERERKLRALLDSAGHYRTSVATFLGYRALGATCFPAAWLVLAAAGGGLGPRAVAAALTSAGAAWFIPKAVVERRGRSRLAKVDREVPELVDLLVTTVEAGVGFAAALQLAARSIRGPLGEELRLALREQSMGLTTDETLRNMATRVDSPAMRAFIQALLQGEALGVSIGKFLRDLAVEMRTRRRQAAEERAQKAPTKILFPLVALILPAMFIVTLGPVMMEALEFLSSV